MWFRLCVVPMHSALPHPKLVNIFSSIIEHLFIWMFKNEDSNKKMVTQHLMHIYQAIFNYELDLTRAKISKLPIALRTLYAICVTSHFVLNSFFGMSGADKSISFFSMSIYMFIFFISYVFKFFSTINIGSHVIYK